ncbi:MAG TPA: AAA family ATPase [Acidimicrobiia bacterium]|nr:AAA family ATPase [Acidimicrobiia bacterium]
MKIVDARPLLGRDQDLAVVEAFLTTINDGSALLSLEGEAGIGKTALWEQAMAEARARGWSVLTTRPGEAERSLSFAGLNDLLSGVEEDSWSDLPSPQRAALEAALLRAPAGIPVESGAIAIAFLSLLNVISTRHSLIVGVDDYQWLDRPTARALEFALRRMTNQPVRALLTCRSDATASWERVLSEDRVKRWKLGPLSLAALYHLIYDRLGVPMGRPTLLRIHQTSEGNPFFALELARELLEHRQDEFQAGPLPLPQGLNELLRRRIGRQSHRMRRLLLTAAAMSSPQVDDLLAVAQEATEADLDKAEAAGILDLRERTVRFTHPMLAASAYSAAARNEREQVHARLANHIADPEEAARHLALATSRPNREAALKLDQAVIRARARGGTDVAAQFAEQALRITPQEDVDLLFHRALVAGDLALAASNQARARDLYDRAISLASPTPDGRRALALLRRAELTSPLRQAIVLCDQALGQADSPGLKSRIHRTLGAISYALGDVSSAERHARQAVQLAEQGEDLEALGRALAELAHWTFCGGGGYRQDLFERAVQLDPSSGASSPRSHYAKITMDAGLLEKAQEQLVGLLDEAHAQGDLQAVAAHHLHLAQLEMWMGEFGRAVDHAEESLLLHEYSDQPGAPRHVKAMSLACLGQLDSAQHEANEGIKEAEKSENVLLTIYNLHVLGFIELSRVNMVGAHDYLERAIELHRPRWNREFGDAHFVPDQVEVLIALGRLEEADDLVSWVEQVGAATRRPWTLATGARIRGLLLAAKGRSEEADRSLRFATEFHREVKMPFEEARTLLVHGVLLRRRKQRAEAALILERARELFSSMGSSLWAAKATAEQARLGVRSQAQASLTPIEETIASLASEGHNNRQIADLLFISRKTVEANLTHVYRKLGIRSRAQLGIALSKSRRPTPSK